MPILNLKGAEEVRNAITKKQQREIKDLYKQVEINIQERMKQLNGRKNISSLMRTDYLLELEKEIHQQIEQMSPRIQNLTVDGMSEVSQAVVLSTRRVLRKLGINTYGILMNVPHDIVSSIATGNVYKNGWNLSNRIWGIQNKTMKDIHSIIAKGVAENKSVYDIAKDLEVFVNPSASKNWDWNKVYPGTNRKIDYNAQRLARTLTQHAFQQSTLKCNNPNPFVTGYIWHSADIHGRTCEECRNRDGMFFDKDDVPMDHPNGLCTILPYVEDDLVSIAEKIADWNEAPEGTYPEIDEFYTFLRTN